MCELVKKLEGKWKQASVENFEAFMLAIGVNFALRKIGNHTSADEEWNLEGDVITLKISSTFKNKTLVFKLGEEIDEETMDGRKMKTTFTAEGDKLVHNQVGKPHNCTYTRYLEGDLLVLEMTVNAPTPVTATRKFKRA
ncbi:fatty acid-binding protein, liver-like [Watersipora subatra]|uniref:fatty acid-binding protein, liver-like n=1 Tax=Watersipora subatra TaxID=2589382 RepID=UPI00355B8E20